MEFNPALAVPLLGIPKLRHKLHRRDTMASLEMMAEMRFIRVVQLARDFLDEPSIAQEAFRVGLAKFVQPLLTWLAENAAEIILEMAARYAADSRQLAGVVARELGFPGPIGMLTGSPVSVGGEKAAINRT